MSYFLKFSFYSTNEDLVFFSNSSFSCLLQNPVNRFKGMGRFSYFMSLSLYACSHYMNSFQNALLFP